MYSKSEKAIIFLNMFDFLTIEKRHHILSCFENAEKLFDDFKDSYETLKNYISKNQFDEMCAMLNDEQIDNEIVSLEKDKIKIITCYSNLYPQDFLNYLNFPLILYCKGDVELLASFSIAVVGTRKLSRYGASVTEKLVKGLVNNGVTIISGMATGVDTIAHTICLDNNGKTIAVIGSGFNEVYPKTNYALFNRIVENGLVISEYPPSMPALPQNFPIRNRIIAMLSSGVLMTEAGEKSGALYTINYAIEYGKDIFVVPGNIDNFSSVGCNNVLKSCQGAITTCVDDILSKYNFENKFQKVQKSAQVTVEEQLILNAIGNGEVFFDEILSQTKLDTKTLVRLLTNLELNGLIKKNVGN